MRLGQLEVDQSHFEDLVASVPVDALSLVSRDEKTGRIQAARKKSELEGFAVPFALVMLLAMMVMVGASPMLSAVTEDKTQRVVEMLLGVATPFELMAGRCWLPWASPLPARPFTWLEGPLLSWEWE